MEMFGKKYNFPEMKEKGIETLDAIKTLKGRVGIDDDEPPALMVGKENISDLLTEMAVVCYGKQVEVEIKVRVTL